MSRILLLCYSCPQAPVALVISDFQLCVCSSGRPLVSSCISPFSSAALEIFLSSKLRESGGSLFFSSLRQKPDLPDVQNKKTYFLYCFFFKWIQAKGYISSLLTHFDQKWKCFNKQLNDYFIISVCWNFHLFKSTKDTMLHCICFLMSVTNPIKNDSRLSYCIFGE